MYSQINNPTKSSSSKNIFDLRAFGFLGHEGPRRLWKKPAHARVARARSLSFRLSRDTQYNSDVENVLKQRSAPALLTSYAAH